jgi:hypothetical protein
LPPKPASSASGSSGISSVFQELGEERWRQETA